MSETAPVVSAEKSPAASEAHVELARSNVERAAEGAPTPERVHEQAEMARNVIEKVSQPSAPLALPVDDSDEGDKPQYVDKIVKAIGLKQQLKHIRRKLPASERALARVVHQPAVRAVSEVGAKTVSRPSGMLGGGICAFLGSLGYLYLAKHIGFTYNYLLFALLFVGGFVVGVMIELIVDAARPKSPQV